MLCAILGSSLETLVQDIESIPSALSIFDALRLSSNLWSKSDFESRSQHQRFQYYWQTLSLRCINLSVPGKLMLIRDTLKRELQCPANTVIEWRSHNGSIDAERKERPQVDRQQSQRGGNATAANTITAASTSRPDDRR